MARRIEIAEDMLVAMLARKEARGMEILYDNYSAALYGTIFRIIGKDEIAEDVLQETFLKIWNNFSQYDAAKGRLFTWMVNIARNLAIDKVRSKEFITQSKNRPIEDSVSSLGAGQQTSFNADIIGIKEIVRKLEPEYKELIDLLYFGGYTQSEAAEKLSIPLGTVKTRSRAAIMKLRKMIDS